jgi:hypothetical protein
MPRLTCQSGLVDVGGDGRPDVRVSFKVPNDPKAPLHVDVDALNSRCEAMSHAGKDKYSRLIVRVRSLRDLRRLVTSGYRGITCSRQMRGAGRQGPVHGQSRCRR